MAFYYPYLPDPNTDKPLTEAIQPRGWEHLSGPFQWFEFTGQGVEENDEFGYYIEVRTVGSIGSIAQHLSENGVPPQKTLLLAGPGGTGKTAFEMLLSMTILADERRPVTYKTDDGRDDITLINEETGAPFYLNPVEKKLAKWKYVQRAFHSPGNESNPAIQFYNTANINIDGVRSIAESLQADASRLESRVVILSEIDNIKKTQMPPFKNALDTNGAIPDGTIVIADTNHLDDVRSNMGAAGLQRFDIVHISPWTADDLAFYAEVYSRHFGITFKPDVGEPYYTIAERSQGAMRELLKHLQHLRGNASKDEAFGQETLEKLIRRDEEASGENSYMVQQFMHQIVGRGSTTVGAFCARMAQRQMSPLTFGNQLAEYLLDSYSQRLSQPEVGAAIHDMAVLSHESIRYGGRHMVWGAFVAPLTTIKDHLESNSA